MPNVKTPLVIWVVGDNTNVGKTTISAALIRSLNKLGRPTLGFKPYAGARLIDVVDLLEKIAKGDRLLAGRDARKLVEASPLLSTEMLEVVNPSWRVSHPVRDVGLLIRKGSLLTGSRSLMFTERAQSLWNLPDFSILNHSIDLPIHQMQIIPNADADHLDFDGQDVQAASFKFLKSLAPDCVVCEGAGRLLPVWFDAPSPDHLFLISSGMLHFFPSVSLTVDAQKSGFGPFTIAHIMNQLNGARHNSALIPVTTASNLDEVMDAFVYQFTKVLL